MHIPTTNAEPAAAGLSPRAGWRALALLLLALLLLALLLLALPPLATAVAKEKEPPRPLFAADDSLRITLQAPWQEVTRKGATAQRHAAVLAYMDAAGVERRIEATVETRGVTRLRMCRFPPLRLRFAKAATQGTAFEGQRSLKMVTHCQPGEHAGQYYVRELLAYRIYNLVTESSFRARPLDVTYLDARGGRPDGPRFAFLIEDLDDVARRNGLKPSPKPRFEPGDFEPLALGRFMLFQYLIGNTDWGVLSGPNPDECCHNVRVAGPRDGDGKDLVALPYDFDSSGMVDADYAAPHESLPISDVKQRLFRGFCQHNDALATARREFLGHREAILALVNDETRLTTQRRHATKRYLAAFYAMLADDAAFAREITGKCRR